MLVSRLISLAWLILAVSAATTSKKSTSKTSTTKITSTTKKSTSTSKFSTTTKKTTTSTLKTTSKPSTSTSSTSTSSTSTSSTSTSSTSTSSSSSSSSTTSTSTTSWSTSTTTTSTSTTSSEPPVTTTTPSATVIVPLYIYPSYTAWEPLYTSLAKNPTLKFQVVVNTFNNWSNGTDATPDVYYITGINTLRSYPNAVPLCYVHTGYTTRPIADVEADIMVCANWKKQITWGSDFHMSGVFFDETVYDYNSTTLEYMTNITTFARTNLGVGNDLVVFNPGRVVPSEWYNLADYVVAYENSVARYSSDTIGWIAPANRARSLFIMYGFLGNAAEQIALVNSIVKAGIGGLFISTESVYTAWSSLWAEFCKAVDFA